MPHPDPATGPSPIRILHTADLQLGMPFHWVAGDAGAKLREARLEALSRIGEVAIEERVDVVLVAGDFFDANSVDERTVASACARIREAGVLFVVIPGNHDFCAGPDAIYRRRDFLVNRPPNLLVLTEAAPVSLLDGRLLVLPAPLTKRHSVEDTTAHITATFGADLAPDAVRVGLAHGDVVGFTRDDDGRARNYIPAERAALGELDYLALGDWHGMKQINERTWYSGAPEPTGFKGNGAGSVLVVTLPGRGVPPQVKAVAVARLAFSRVERELYTAEDVSSLEAELSQLPAARDTVLALKVSGLLGSAEQTRVDDLLRRVRGEVLHLRYDSDGLGEAFTIGDLDEVVPEGFAKSVGARLMARAGKDGDEGRRAALALSILRRTAIQTGGL